MIIRVWWPGLECPEKTQRGPSSVSPTLSGPTIVSSASTRLVAKVSNDLLGAPQWGLSTGMAFHPLQEILGSEKQRPTQKHEPRVLHCPLLGLQFHTSEVPGEWKVSPMRAQNKRPLRTESVIRCGRPQFPQHSRPAPGLGAARFFFFFCFCRNIKDEPSLDFLLLAPDYEQQNTLQNYHGKKQLQM